MTYDFRLPDIGEGVAEGEVVKWFVEEGGTVQEDAPLVSVLTDKANVEIPSPKAGRIAKIHAAVGQKVKVGGLLVSIETGGPSSSAPPTEKPASPGLPRHPSPPPTRRRPQPPRAPRGASLPPPRSAASPRSAGSTSRRFEAQGPAVGSPKPMSSPAPRQSPLPTRRHRLLRRALPRQRPRPPPPRPLLRPRPPWSARSGSRSAACAA